MFYNVIYIYIYDVRLCQLLRVSLSVTALQRIQLRPSIPPIKLSAPARSWQKLQNHSSCSTLFPERGMLWNMSNVNPGLTKN